MSGYCGIHESRMSDLGMILPRVGGGVGGRGGARILYLAGAAPRPVDNRDALPLAAMRAEVTSCP